MSHDHRHHHARGHHHHAGEGRLKTSIGLNLLITIVEVFGGLVSGSLALLSDALHNFSDTSSLVISLIARRVSRRAASSTKTFGYQRAEIIGAFINLITLVIVALFLIEEAIDRLLHPQPIDGLVMLVVAVVGLLANAATALLLWRDAKDGLNMRSAFLHIVGDAVSSVGVVLGGVLIMQYGTFLVDPLLTFAIAFYILFNTYQMLRQTIDILMESTPPGLDLTSVTRAVHDLDFVIDMHHIHVWQLDERHAALEAHIAIDRRDLSHMEEIKAEIKALLSTRFDITHSTLEFEFLRCDTEPHLCFEKRHIHQE